jgi:hypothetical protein
MTDAEEGEEAKALKRPANRTLEALTHQVITHLVITHLVITQQGKSNPG